MNPSRVPARIRLLTALIIGVLLSSSGCATPEASVPRSPSTAAQTAAPRPGPPLSQTIGMTRSAVVQAAVLPLGAIPYDDHTLPVVSPSGRFLATEAGIKPYWETVVADPDGPVPEATRVEIYELTYDGQAAARRVHILEEPVLLGRACNEEGFLVESQRPDGGRWIGRAAWRNGRIDWLVRSGDTNAFATAGPNGQLAWSRRRAGGGSFDLVIRRADGQEWLVATGDDWLFPTWSGKDDGLFVLRLRDGALDLCHAAASNSSSFRQSLQWESLASSANIDTAYLTMVVGSLTLDVPPPSHESLIFNHPAHGRAALWRPFTVRDGRLSEFGRGSYAALLVDDGPFALVSTDNHLWLQSMVDEKDRAQLLGGLMIPRRTARTDWPYVLMAPTEGRVVLTAMRLLSR